MYQKEKKAYTNALYLRFPVILFPTYTVYLYTGIVLILF